MKKRKKMMKRSKNNIRIRIKVRVKRRGEDKDFYTTRWMTEANWSRRFPLSKSSKCKKKKEYDVRRREEKRREEKRREEKIGRASCRERGVEKGKR